MSRAAAFNVDAFVAAASPQSAAPSAPAERLGMSLEWARGMSRLMEIPVPRGASERRWRQVVADTTTFADEWHQVATECCWTIGHLFGFDPDQALDRVGLVLSIRGGRVIRMSDVGAEIRCERSSVFVSKSAPADSPPLWNLRSLDR